MRVAQLFLAVVVAVTPGTLRGQSDAAFPLSTKNPTAVAEFRTGMRLQQYASDQDAATHFAAALKADPSFGLARALWVVSSHFPTTRERDAEMARAISDAAHGTDAELLAAVAIREFVNGHPEIGGAIYRSVSRLVPSDRFAEFVSTFTPDLKARLAGYRDLA